MRNLKKIIESKILSTGFDVVGFSNPYVDKNTKENYFNFLKKNHLIIGISLGALLVNSEGPSLVTTIFSS